MRVELNEFQPGAYAEILDKIPWKVLKIASRTAKRPDGTIPDLSPEETEKINEITLKTMVRFWNVKDTTGADVPIPQEATEAQIDMVDGLIIAKLLGEVIKLTKQVKIDPNSGNASSMS